MIRHKHILSTSFSLLVLAALACNFGAEEGADATAAVQTVVATLSTAVATPAQEAVAAADTETPTPEGAAEVTTEGEAATATDTAAPKPTDTQGPTNTPGAQGCSDGAQFVADITVPDDTVFLPGAAFIKTWRLRNSGTCTWNNSYSYRFVGGAQMSGPSSVTISGTVAPGAEVDLSVNLVAPSAPGTYKGTWRMHNPGNAAFGSTPFVQIVVASPTSTPTQTVEPSQTGTATQTGTPTNTPTATATPAGADLVVSSAVSASGADTVIYVAPQPANPTTSWTFNVRVKNIGTVGALGSFVQGAVQGSLTIACLAPPSDPKNTPPLAPAEESVVIPVDVDTVGYGTFTLEFTADFCGVIAEQNEGNNTMTVVVTVS
ncbi:MAG: NBR1-Ig-like domain-containing protein [Anaerolineales bacterium]